MRFSFSTCAGSFDFVGVKTSGDKRACRKGVEEALLLRSRICSMSFSSFDGRRGTTKQSACLIRKATVTVVELTFPRSSASLPLVLAQTALSHPIEGYNLSFGISEAFFLIAQFGVGEVSGFSFEKSLTFRSILRIQAGPNSTPFVGAFGSLPLGRPPRYGSRIARPRPQRPLASTSTWRLFGE